MKRETGIRIASALALAGTVVAPLAIAAPASASTGYGHAPYCYQQPLQRLSTSETPNLARGENTYTYSTDDIMVTDGSPCQDINLRAAQSNGAPTCAQFRVHFHGQAPAPWVTVCRGWRVALYGATEGWVYTVESKTVGSVIVRG